MSESKIQCASENSEGVTADISPQTVEGHGNPDNETAQCTETTDNDIPRVGMSFQSEESAFDFYCTYAEKLGFIIRKGSVKRLRDGTISRRTLVCSKEGHTDFQRTKERKFPIKNRPPKRTGCMACISYVMKEKEGKAWYITKFISEHNHHLGIQEKKKSKLKALRQLEAQESEEIDNLNELSMRPSDNFNYASGEMPQVGMIFQSEQSAFRFYKAYAQRVGFIVRKGKLMRLRNGVISRRYFVCSSEGHQEQNKALGKKIGPQQRTDCKARVVFKIVRDDEWPWVVNEVISEHNHPLGVPPRPLKFQRIVQPVKPVDGIYHASQIVEKVDNSSSVKLESGRSSLTTKRAKRLKRGDAQHLLDYFERMQLADPSFFYAIQVDKDDQLTNFFWADANSILNYGYFGDVVCLDTTYRAHVSNLPFASFVGINHHKQVVLFGGALLFDETMDSFVWLFETWMKAMRGQHPKTIFTDQCSTIENALSFVLLESTHRLCLCQIFVNTLRHLTDVHENNSSFINDFKDTIYQDETEDDFLSSWNKMIEKYNLVENTWLRDLYDVREKWSLVYGRGSFCASMSTVEHHDAIRKLLNERLKRNVPLVDFVNDYERTLTNLYEEELHADFDSKQNEPPLCLNVPMLKTAADKYTRKAFDMFDEQFKHCFCCRVDNHDKDGLIHSYRVSQFGHTNEFLVTFDSSKRTITCSCKKFESVGILCMHALKILNLQNLFDLPHEYILRRWTKDAKVGAVRHPKRKIFDGHNFSPLSLRYAELCYKSVGIVTKGALTEKTLSVANLSLEKALEELETLLKVETSHKCQTDSQINEAGTECSKNVKDYDDDDAADSSSRGRLDERMAVETQSTVVSVDASNLHDMQQTDSHNVQQKKRKLGGLSNGVANAGVMRPRLILPANFRSLSPNATVRVHPRGSVPYVLFRPPQANIERIRSLGQLATQYQDTQPHVTISAFAQTRSWWQESSSGQRKSFRSKSSLN